jgi:hypothetical protein
MSIISLSQNNLSSNINVLRGAYNKCNINFNLLLNKSFRRWYETTRGVQNVLRHNVDCILDAHVQNSIYGKTGGKSFYIYSRLLMFLIVFTKDTASQIMVQRCALGLENNYFLRWIFVILLSSTIEYIQKCSTHWEKHSFAFAIYKLLCTLMYRAAQEHFTWIDQ